MFLFAEQVREPSELRKTQNGVGKRQAMVLEEVAVVDCSAAKESWFVILYLFRHVS